MVYYTINLDAFKLLQKILNPESFYLGQNDWNILHFCAANGAEVKNS